jgi:hypothetical protein
LNIFEKIPMWHVFEMILKKKSRVFPIK